MPVGAADREVGTPPVPGIRVAGIPIVHHAPAGWRVDDGTYPGWVDGRSIDAPLHITHAVARAPGTAREDALVLDAPDAAERYFVDADGDLVVRFGPRRVHEREQWMRTVRAGHEYAIEYAAPDECPKMQWRWQRTAVTYALASRERGVKAHAAGFVVPGVGGVLCPGASGSGNCTLARLVAAELGARAVLSDDRVAVTREPDGVRIWGTPWHSSAMLGGSADAPLAAVVLATRSHGAAASVRRVRPAEALPHVLRAVAAPFWRARLLDAMLRVLDDALSSAPVYELSYTPGDGAASPLWDALGVHATEGRA